MKNRRIVINYLWNISYQFSVVVIPLIIVPYISRIFGAEGIGIYSSINGVSMLFYFLGIMGISNYGYKKIGSVSNNKSMYSKTFYEIYIIQLIFSLVSITSFVIIFIFFNVMNDFMYIALSLPFVLSSLFDISWLFIGIEDMSKVSIRNLLIKISAMILIFIFVKDKSDLWVYFLIQSMSFLIGYILLFLIGKKVLDRNQIFNIELKIHIKEILILSIPVISIQIYTQFDRTLVMILSDNANAGYYDQSLKMAKIINPFISSLSIAIMPRISNLFFHNNSVEIKKLLGKSLNFTIIASLLLAGLVIVISPHFVILFFGNSFSNIISLVQYAALLIIIIPIGGVFANQIALPLNRTREYVIPTVIGAIISIVLGLILIPSYGARGAVFSIIITELIVALLRIYLVREYISIKKHLFQIRYFIIVFFLLLIIGYLLNVIISFGFLINTIITGSIYCFLYFLLVLLNKKYRNILFEFMFKKKGGHKNV